MTFGQNRDADRAIGNSPAPLSRSERGILCLGMLLPTLLAWGCSGIVSGQSSTASTPPPQTFSISGTITPVAGGNGATVTIAGPANATATANSSGNFTVSGLGNGTYTITPSHAGYSFSPSSMTVTINNASVTTGISFTATALTFGISGTLSPVAGGSGATVTLSGAAAATTTADSAGNYTFGGLSNGTYAVTPNHAGYTFNPSVQQAVVSGANVTGVNFTAQSNPTFSISGTISPVTGGGGSTVTLSGAAAATTIADSSGNYTFAGLGSGSYAVTPSNTGYTFSPSNQSVNITTASVGSINFTATPQVTHTVALTWNASTSPVSGYNVYRSSVNGAGYVKINSTLVSLLAYTDTSVQNGTTYYYVTTAVDPSGAESGFSNQATAVIP
jgi:hypothetical protein